jgi:hypothetical protein
LKKAQIEMTNEITIESLEALASKLEQETATHAAKLERIIRAFARIIHAREPRKFARQPCGWGDEAGCSDNSYPPEKEYRDYTGPRLLEIIEEDTEEVPTSDGFYYSYRVTGTDPGLYIAADGSIWGAMRTGTGRFGQFAAHPGHCDVEVSIEYDQRRDVSTEELETAEKHLRKLAFPLIEATQAATP